MYHMMFPPCSFPANLVCHHSKSHDQLGSTEKKPKHENQISIFEQAPSIVYMKNLIRLSFLPVQSHSRNLINSHYDEFASTANDLTADASAKVELIINSYV
jgi:hypothetical protein